MQDTALFGDAAPARPARPPWGRIDALRVEARAARRIWRWHWQRFWILRWENTLRRPGWRVEEEGRAWRRMRAEVRRYARLRAQIAGQSAALAGSDAAPG